ncbi:MAG TPA: V-type ATP synthase subunit B [Candidatus Dormibacteraeota bacterium]|nr:V-type ATP synthase subunit B [Candidatus Dormibacteraeota bacterium]
MINQRQLAVEYADVASVDGPLLVVRGVRGAGWDEQVTVRLDGGEVRHGQVLEVDRDLAVVEVFEGGDGIKPDGVHVRFMGSPIRVPVGEAWLGRVANGRGEVIDGGPPLMTAESRPVTGEPINPARREPPRDPIITGVSAIDGLTTLVRGQKLPIFSLGGLPHLELAVQVAAQATAPGSSFRVIFAAIGITNADADMVRDALDDRAEKKELALFINLAGDPVVERILVPRLALTVAEHLAFDLGHHVLVVLCDMTSYCEAVREAASARGEIPGRRGYPGHLYSDLASIYERCGRLRDRRGSITQLPVLTMPAGDITHPVPDLTGYITEGQLVLSQEMQGKTVYPPFDALASLSRLMRNGAGEGRTRADHLAVAAQTFAALARAREVRELEEMVGSDALSETDRSYLRFVGAVEQTVFNQRRDQGRALDATLDLMWQALGKLPKRELTMLTVDMIDEHLPKGVAVR